MNLETEHRILRKLANFTQLELDTCAQEAEVLYTSLSDSDIAKCFSNQIYRYEDTSDDWLLAIQITKSFQDSLYEVIDNLTKILYAKKCLPEYYEVAA